MGEMYTSEGYRDFSGPGSNQVIQRQCVTNLLYFNI